MLAFSGLAILISDQTVTPFDCLLSFDDDADLTVATVYVGEVGGGKLGISGPKYSSAPVTQLLSRLGKATTNVPWVYRANYYAPERS